MNDTPETDAVSDGIEMLTAKSDSITLYQNLCEAVEEIETLKRECDEARDTGEAFSALAWKLEKERNDARKERDEARERAAEWAAFPMQGTIGADKNFIERPIPGMSLRDWFAGQALTGLLASGHFTNPNNEEENDGSWMTTHPYPWDENGEPTLTRKRRFDFPEAAWRCADAMLQERTQEGVK